MDILHAIIGSPAVKNLVMTFLHSLWQGAVLAGLLWCLLRTPGGQPSRRYAHSALALLALIILMFFTYALLEQQTVFPAPTHAQPSSVGGQESSSAPPDVSPPVSAKTSSAQRTWNDSSSNGDKASSGLDWQAYVFMLWLAGACLMAVRMFILIGGAFRLRHSCALNTDDHLIQQFDQLKGHMQMARRVALGFSSQVLVPCTVGCIRAMIILPAAMVGMDPQDVKTVLLHELAHIKRLDWLVNVVQMLLESILFFNPAVWWISHQMRIEREAACDAYVVAHTQKPVQYAQVLLRFATASQGPMHAVALALSSTSGSAGEPGSSLGERIRRLVVPGYRPHVHPGIIPVLLTLIALGFCGVGAYKTSSATIRYFGQHMTAQERADTVHTLNEEYHPKQGQPADLPKDQWLRIKGRIVTEDGLPLPTKTYQYHGKDRIRVDAHIMTRTGNASANHSIAADGTFDFTLRQSLFTVSVVCKGYAPQHIKLEYDPGAVVEDLKIILAKGYTASIRFVNPQHQPISAVRVTGGYPPPPRYGSYVHSIKEVSDDDGIVRFDHASDALMSLICQASGFAKTSKRKVHLLKNSVMAWVLEPAVPSEIQITDRRTGQPIEDAPVYVNGKEFNSSFGGKQGEIQTDTTGRAVLDSLVPEERYLVMIHPQGMQRQYFSITAGESIQAEFDPVTPIKGRIVGDLSRLKNDDRGPYLQVTNTYHESKSSSRTNAGGKVYVDVVNDQEAVFLVDDYYGQEVVLRAADEEYTVDVDKTGTIKEIVFNLSPREISTAGTRRVSFTFNSTNPIRPGSQFKLMYQSRGSHYTEPHSVEIINGQAETHLHLPVNLHWEPLPGTNIFFKKGHQNLDQDRDYHLEIDCQPAGSVFGVVNVPRDFRYEYVYMRIEFLNRDELFQRTGFLPDNGFNMTSQAQTKFMFSPLPLNGRYSVSFSCKNMYIASDEIHLSDEQPLCELDLPWPERTVTLRGRILNQTGAPAANLAYNISVQAEKHGRTFGAQTTDEKGQFECINVNPAHGLAYSIVVKPKHAPWFEHALDVTEAPATVRIKQGYLLRGVLKDHAGKIRPDAEFHLSPALHAGSRHQYRSQTIQTDSQGRFQAHLGGIDYNYYARRSLGKNKYGHLSYSVKSVSVRPGKDQDVTVFIDPSDH